MNQADVFNQVTEHISNEYTEAVEKVYERFVEYTGTDNAQDLQEMGYRIYRVKRQLRDNDAIREAHILVRGDRVINGTETSVVSSGEIKTYPLNKGEVQSLLKG